MKKKNGTIKNIICVFLFTAAVLFFLNALFHLLTRKNSFEKYTPFYQAEENFDVLFFGTSHGCNGFAPMELWDSYGIASYNLCQHSEYPAVTYYQLLNALTYTSPSLVVIDPYLVGTSEKIPDNREDWSYVHDSLDAMPLSALKLNAVRDLIPGFENQMEFLFPFIMYHNRWDSLDATDFVPEYSLEKGAESRVGNTRLADFTPIPEKQAYDLSGIDLMGLHYLDLIIEECKSRNIDVLLAILPYQADENAQNTANGLKSYAAQKEVGYINLFYENPLNYSTDFYDSGHMNPSGYKKTSDYLGAYLAEHYNLPDHREDPLYNDWYQDYEIYAARQIDFLKETNDFYVYMTLLQNKNLSFTIHINGNSAFLANPFVAPYLANLGITTDLKALAESDKDFFALIDRSENTVSEFVGEHHIELYPSFGQVLYDCADDGSQSFQVGTEYYTGDKRNDYIHVTVINNRTGEVADNIVFYTNTYYEWFRQE